MSPDHNTVENYIRKSKNDPLVCKVNFSFKIFRYPLS